MFPVPPKLTASRLSQGSSKTRGWGCSAGLPTTPDLGPGTAILHNGVLEAGVTMCLPAAAYYGLSR